MAIKYNKKELLNRHDRVGWGGGRLTCGCEMRVRIF